MKSFTTPKPYTPTDTLKEFKTLIRKLKIDSVLEKRNVLSSLEFNVDRCDYKQNNSIAKKFSKYGCLTGSYMYSALGLIEKTYFKDIDLIVNTENYNAIIKKNYHINEDSWYNHIDTNSVGTIKHDGYVIDIFVIDDVDYIEYDGFKFQKNIIDALGMKAEIFENNIKDDRRDRYFNIEKDIRQIISVLNGKSEPHEYRKEPTVVLDIFKQIKDFFI